jgi:hypothetical protein
VRRGRAIELGHHGIVMDPDVVQLEEFRDRLLIAFFGGVQ